MSAILCHNDWIRINNIVLRMNQENDTMAALQIFLTEIESLIPYEKSTIFFYSYANNQFKVDSYIERNFSEKEMQTYNNYYCQIDEIIMAMLPTTIHTIRCTDLLSSLEREKTEYYVDYIKPANTHCSLDSNFIWHRNNSAVNFGSVDLFRSKGSVDFSERELVICDILRPHVENRASKFIFSYDDQLKGLLSHYSLTKCEEDIARFIIRGYSNEMIAKEMFNTVSTIKKHITNILEKTESISRIDFICKIKL